MPQLTKFALTVACLLLCIQQAFAQKPDFSKVPGAIVTHVPASTETYIGSPSICKLPNGDYLASADLFGPKSNERQSGISLIFRSNDKGKTWSQIATIKGQFWSKLFVHRNQLYFFGTAKHNGNTIIRHSPDGGVTWTEPTNSSNGLLLEGDYHCAPTPIIEHNGRLWRTMEDALSMINKNGRKNGAFVMSIPVDADLMNANNWTSSRTLDYELSFLTESFGGWLEGNAVVDPQGNVVDFLRVNPNDTKLEKAAIIKLSKDGETASFDPETGFIPFSGGSKKFSIIQDPATGMYWTLVNNIPAEISKKFPDLKTSHIRNTLSLYCSNDLRTWEYRKTVLQHPDAIVHAFQYVDWIFDGNDILLLSRTSYDDGLGGANSYHDANFLTFHRIKNFRKAVDKQ
jgi:hypothetical protein